MSPGTVLFLCALCCHTWTLVRAATVLRNGTLTYEDLASAVGCEANSTPPQLTFITTLSVRGCPMFVHRVGEVKVGRFVVEPTFCITDAEALRHPNAHYHLFRRQHYFSFPVKVTDESVLSEIEPQLRRLSPKSISFLEVIGIRLNSAESLAYQEATFLWGQTEAIGHLRMSCKGFMCQSLLLYLSMGQTEAFESVTLEATIQVSEGCGSVTRTYPLTIAHIPFLPVVALQRSRQSDLRTCSDLHLFRALQIGNCTVFVYKRQDKKGQFVIEPLLCPRENFSLRTDYSFGRHYLVLRAMVQNSTVVDRVRALLSLESAQSIAFMKLWDANIHVMENVSQWEVQPLRLSTDRKSAEFRVHCDSQASCELLSSILRTEPVNFWKNIQWTATYMIGDECEVRSERRRFAFRMKERKSSSLPGQPVEGKWDFKALQSRVVTRNGRSFIVILQRGCRKSNFVRTWNEYVEGFGDSANYWMGLELLHSLTSPQDTKMRVEMLLWNDTEWHAEYSGFRVGNSTTKYLMSYNAMVKSASNLSFDAMEYSKGYPFSTGDVDNVRHSSNGYCPSYHGGAGWWHRSCSYANPNGVYAYSDTTAPSYSVWYFVEGYKTIKEFQMMIQF